MGVIGSVEMPSHFENGIAVSRNATSLIAFGSQRKNTSILHGLSEVTQVVVIMPRSASTF